MRREEIGLLDLPSQAPTTLFYSNRCDSCKPLPPCPPPRPPQLYCLDAQAVADEVGLGRRVNMVMQAAFFALSGVVDIKEVSPGGRHLWIWCVFCVWCSAGGFGGWAGARVERALATWLPAPGAALWFLARQQGRSAQNETVPQRGLSPDCLPHPALERRPSRC